LLTLLWRASTIKSRFPSILSLLHRYLLILAPVISTTAVVVTELFASGADYLFAAFSAFGHWKAFPFSTFSTIPAPNGNEKTELVKNKS
jgi:hypothetical protein